jgi:hypothetical protein
MHSATNLECAKPGSVRSNTDVAGHREFDAMAYAPSIDRGNSRLVKTGEWSACYSAKPSIYPITPHHRTNRLLFGRMSFEIRTGCECVSRARNDCDTHGRVISKVSPYFAQSLVRFDVDGVFYFRSI